MNIRRRYRNDITEVVEELLPFGANGMAREKAEKAKTPTEMIQNVEAIAVLLHDISNAIVNIVLAVEVLKRDQRISDEKVKDLIEIIESGARRAAAELKVMRTLCKR